MQQKFERGSISERALDHPVTRIWHAAERGQENDIEDLMKALVVDDSRAMRMLLTQILKENGFEVAQAPHGKDALAHLEANPETRVALVDWNMPEMNGLELVQAVRKNAALSRLRMVMVTTETEMSHVQAAISAGANEYVMKPFTKDAIAEKLRLLGLAN